MLFKKADRLISNKIPAFAETDSGKNQINSSLWEGVRRTDGLMKNNIYHILRGKFLVSDDSFKNWRIIIFISLLAIIMIASSHSADQKVHDIARLNNEVKEWRSAFVDGRSKLMRLKMESGIVQKMSEKGIEPSSNPPKKIKVKKEED